ncbi:MAG TPA: TonB family protein [Lacunisphaera sp.]|nr:TonB family protein [Lacunisphaera sp.]
MAGPGTGTSSFKVVEAPAAAPPKSTGKAAMQPTSRAQYRDAQIKGEPVLPVYPARALAAKAGGAQVGVHIVIDAQGRVSDVRPSMVAVTIAPPEFAADFQRAVEAAVRQWRFVPARAQYIETVTGTGGFTYDRVARTEDVEAEVDLAFTFTPNGKVQAK